jgi:hypothetical protein
VARRQGYIELFRNRYRGAAIVHLDTGNFFSDRIDFATRALARDAVVGNEWVIRAYDHMALDAVNVSYRDLPQLARCFAADEWKRHAATTPVVLRFVSANIRARDRRHGNPRPFLIKELAGERLKDRRLRLGIVGVSEKGTASESAFVIEDPLVAARRVIAQVRPQVDLLLVMAYLQPPMIDRLVRENPHIDIVLADVGRPQVFEPRWVGKTFVAYTYYQTKMLGELRLYRDARTGAVRYSHRAVELDRVIPDDPSTERLRAQARKEIAAVQELIVRELLGERRRQAAARPGRALTPTYVGSHACQSCHQAAYQVWARSGHAHAYTTLQRVKRENDPQCVICHVTGWGDPSGFVSAAATPGLRDVHCESCHGPASEHITHPARGFGPVAMPAGCVTCHTRENSPDFELVSYWAKIKH